MSVVVKRLTDRKLVARKASREDARRVELSLTPAGHRLLARCPEPTQAQIARVSPPDGGERFLASLTRGLAALVHEMGIEDAEPRMFFEESPPPAAPRARGPGAPRAREPSREDD